MRSAEDPWEEMFEELVKLHRRELTLFAVRQLGEHASLAEDVVQEALLKAHRAIAAGTRPEHPRAWLFTIVRNAAVNATRGARTTDEIEERGYGTAHQSVPAAVEQSEWIAWLMEAVHELPARQRDALVGHAFEGRSYGEIAERQQTTVSAVKSLLTRARRTLSADASLSAIGIGTPLGAVARALRVLRVRGPLAGKAGGAKGLAGVLTQAALAATVTTGVLMAVHGGLGSATAGAVRPPDAGAHHTGAQASASRHGSASKRAREQRVHREARHAVRECMRGALRGHYGETALQSAARHLSTVALEYTECDRELRSAELRAAVRRRHPAHPRRRRHHRPGPRAR
ncbi:MAG TPA: RNA polymerase sigma factor [Solirubrobacteraceae bacterium]|jgi:RNA polymerase sigma-70 factor (ECF subfamily)